MHSSCFKKSLSSLTLNSKKFSLKLNSSLQPSLCFYSPVTPWSSGLQRQVSSIHHATIILLGPSFYHLLFTTSIRTTVAQDPFRWKWKGPGMGWWELKMMATQAFIIFFYCHVTSSVREIFTVVTE